MTIQFKSRNLLINVTSMAALVGWEDDSLFFEALYHYGQGSAWKHRHAIIDHAAPTYTVNISICGFMVS